MTTSIRRSATMTALAALLAIPALALVSPAQALDPAGVGPRDPGDHGFPAYYTDDSGVALQMCDDGTGACLGATPASLDPVDGENFYWMATADMSAPGLDVSVEWAAEAAWLGPTTPITFDRLRIRGHADDPGTYTVTHPYGTTVVEAVGTGTRNINVTEDVGCAGAPCDFAAMTTSANAHITSWITSASAPAGRLGDGASSGPATVAGAPASVSVSGPGGTASTTDFVVMGKLAEPFAVSLPTALDFGNVRAARTRTLRLRNLGTEATTVDSTTVTGSPTITQLPSSTCTPGRVVTVGGSCDVDVRYSPDGRKQSSATVALNDSAPGVRSVRVTARTAAVMSARSRQSFPATSGGTRGATRRIVVTNTGSLPLRLGRISIGGRDRRSFVMRSGAPRVCRPGLTLRVGQQCGAYVGFAPRGFGQKLATLVLHSNGLPASHTVALAGRGG
jgi:hypothetical protein